MLAYYLVLALSHSQSSLSPISVRCSQFIQRQPLGACLESCVLVLNGIDLLYSTKKILPSQCTNYLAINKLQLASNIVLLYSLNPSSYTVN